MITYLKGDATYPQGEGVKLLIHVCNDRGIWSAGFVVALSKRWKEPEYMYKLMPIKKLGMIQTIQVESDIIVVNMVAQTLWQKNTHKMPLNYTALVKCLKNVNRIALLLGYTIHAPKFGSGLAGGNWKVIEQLIEEIITVPVYIYDYEGLKTLNFY